MLYVQIIPMPNRTESGRPTQRSAASQELNLEQVDFVHNITGRIHKVYPQVQVVEVVVEVVVTRVVVDEVVVADTVLLDLRMATEVTLCFLNTWFNLCNYCFSYAQCLNACSGSAASSG